MMREALLINNKLILPEAHIHPRTAKGSSNAKILHSTATTGSTVVFRFVVQILEISKSTHALLYFSGISRHSSPSMLGAKFQH